MTMTVQMAMSLTHSIEKERNIMKEGRRMYLQMKAEEEARKPRVPLSRLSTGRSSSAPKPLRPPVYELKGCLPVSRPLDGYMETNVAPKPNQTSPPMAMFGPIGSRGMPTGYIPAQGTKMGFLIWPNSISKEPDWKIKKRMGASASMGALEQSRSRPATGLSRPALSRPATGMLPPLSPSRSVHGDALSVHGDELQAVPEEQTPVFGAMDPLDPKPKRAPLKRKSVGSYLGYQIWPQDMDTIA